MLDSLGRLAARRPRTLIAVWFVLSAACVALATLGVGGETVFDRLTTGAPTVPGSESEQGEAILAEENPAGPRDRKSVV